MASNHSETASRRLPLASLLGIHTITSVRRLTKLRDLAEFIADAARLTRKALRFNSEECRRRHAQAHPSTAGAIHFLGGLMQEFDSITRAADQRLRSMKRGSNSSSSRRRS